MCCPYSKTQQMACYKRGVSLDKVKMQMFVLSYQQCYRKMKRVGKIVKTILNWIKTTIPKHIRKAKYEWVSWYCCAGHKRGHVGPIWFSDNNLKYAYSKMHHIEKTSHLCNFSIMGKFSRSLPVLKRAISKTQLMMGSVWGHKPGIQLYFNSHLWVKLRPLGQNPEGSPSSKRWKSRKKTEQL